VRIGVLGGTFNPPHLGHLVCAQEAYVQLELNRVMLIPAGIPPHKPLEDEPGTEHRLELCRLAVNGDPRFLVSEMELVRDGPSYTLDTLLELRSNRPHNELFLILGGDIAAGLPEGRHPERVLSLATLAVAARPGTSRQSVEEALARLESRDRARFFRMPRIGISSTLVRQRVKADQPIRYLVRDSVAGYIAREGLYR